MSTDVRFFGGVDWASETHQVCLVAADGKIIGERAFAHGGAGLAEMCDWLVTTSGEEPPTVAVAIEVPHGPVVEILLERRFQVDAVNPKQLDRFRDRFTVAGAKDDRRDAYVLADALRTDRHCFRRLTVEDPVVIELREWSRMAEDLQQERNRLANRVREQLWRYYPQALELGSSTARGAPSGRAVFRMTHAGKSGDCSERRIRRDMYRHACGAGRDTCPIPTASSARRPGESRATLRVRPFCRPRADHADNRSSPDRMNGRRSTAWRRALRWPARKLQRGRAIIRYHGEADATGTRIEIFRVLASRPGLIGVAIDHLDGPDDEDFASIAGLEECVALAEGDFRLIDFNDPFERFSVWVDHRSPQLLRQQPSRPVSEAELILKLPRRHAV